MSDYPAEELKQLNNMWERFRLEWENGNTWEFEAPPALLDASAHILNRALESNTNKPVDQDDVSFEFMVTYGQVMFSFGQYCHQQGLYRSNMTPATFIDESALEQLLKDN